MYRLPRKSSERYAIFEKQQPQTDNHYYTNDIQTARLEPTRKVTKKAMDEPSEQDWKGRSFAMNDVNSPETAQACLPSQKGCAIPSGCTCGWSVANARVVSHKLPDLGIENHLPGWIPRICREQLKRYSLPCCVVRVVLLLHLRER